jgi:hypothetical protein
MLSDGSVGRSHSKKHVLQFSPNIILFFSLNNILILGKDHDLAYIGLDEVHPSEFCPSPFFFFFKRCPSPFKVKSFCFFFFFFAPRTGYEQKTKGKRPKKKEKKREKGKQ